MGKNNIKVIIIVVGIVLITMISTGIYFYNTNRENNNENSKPEPTAPPVPTATPTPSPTPTATPKPETSRYELKDDLDKNIYEMIPQSCDEINSQNLNMFKNDVTLTKDMDPETKIAIVYRLLEKSENSISGFKKDKVDKMWKKVFNEEVNIKPGSYSTNSMCFSYNEDGSLSKGDGCGGACAEKFTLESINRYKSDNTIEVSMQIAFFDYNTQKSYFDVDKTIPLTEPRFEMSYNYKYIFKKKDNNYYLHSVEKGPYALLEKKDPKCSECVMMYNVFNNILGTNKITKKIYLNNEIKTLTVSIDGIEETNELKEYLDVDGKRIYIEEDAGTGGIYKFNVINNEILMVTTHGSYVNSAGIMFFDKDLNKLDVDVTLDEKYPYPKEMYISSFGGPGEGDGIKVEGNKIIIEGSRLEQTGNLCKHKGELLSATYEIEYLGNNKFSKSKQVEVQKIIGDDCWEPKNN